MNELRMFEHNQPGLLITFCGLDGCGKTTQIQMLRQYLLSLSYETVLTKQPTGAVRNSEIFRNYMDHADHSGYEYRSLSLLAASDRVQHANQFILPKLAEGKIVISDRYFYSCIGNLHARGYQEDVWIYEISSYIPKPDLAFFLDIDVEAAVERVRSRPEERERYIDMDLQYALREEYLDLAHKNGGVVLHTSQTPDETFSEIASIVLDRFGKNMHRRSLQSGSLIKRKKKGEML